MTHSVNMDRAMMPITIRVVAGIVTAMTLWAFVFLTARAPQGGFAYLGMLVAWAGGFALACWAWRTALLFLPIGILLLFVGAWVR